jgi:large subunit ribosomal protein L15
MELNTLKPAKNSIKSSKRVGRGQGSGKGGTSTRGNNGAKSRSGYKSKAGFEGGQMPLQRRVPIVGFRSPNRVAYKPINLDTLQRLADKANVTVINPEVLYQYGLLSKHAKCKILGNGALKAKIEITAHAFSASATAAIEKVGGKVNTLQAYA